MGCSPEGCLCFWSNVLQNASVTLQDSVDVGEGSVYTVTSLWWRDCSCCVVATSLANLWVVSFPLSHAEVRYILFLEEGAGIVIHVYCSPTC